MSSSRASAAPFDIPFFRPSLTQAETEEVLDTLRSGWLTTGKKVRRFEADFAALIGSRNAVAVNSCTAALHLAIEALGLKAGQAVLVPTMTFAATAEVVRYLGAVPIPVDCDRRTLNMSIEDAVLKLKALRRGDLVSISDSLTPDTRVVGIIAVHVGGMMMQMDELQAYASQEGLWIVEDAAHAFPAAWRMNAHSPWQRCGEGTANVSCFSFYANKTITTGEGGMAVTDDAELANRMREDDVTARAFPRRLGSILRWRRMGLQDRRAGV
jgi:perosamine synthetase